MVKIRLVFLVLNLLFAIVAVSYSIDAQAQRSVVNVDASSSSDLGPADELLIRPGQSTSPIPAGAHQNPRLERAIELLERDVELARKQVDLQADNLEKILDEEEKLLNQKKNEAQTQVEEQIKQQPQNKIKDFFGNEHVQNLLFATGAGLGVGAIISPLLGLSKKNSAALGAAATVGTLVFQYSQKYLADQVTYPFATSLGLGLLAGGIIILLFYKDESEELISFSCLPWEAPIGGKDCELCNEFEECSLYTCKSLGQACSIVNEGTEEQKCVWQNPRDVNSPKITFLGVNKGHIFKPDQNVRPPAVGVEISLESGEKCIQAFTPLEFTFKTNEPAKCKIDYNLTNGFEEMLFLVGGSNLFRLNHTEKLSLPGPDAINALAPELQNDGRYSLYIRCQDANGNFNQDAYSINFCVDPGPDTTPPLIDDVSIPSGSPIRFNQTNLDLEVYVNEPSECRWSRVDANFESMDEEMICDTQIFQMNNKNLYTCRTTLTGLQDRKENNYYFRCKDKPGRSESERNVNSQSFLYTVIGTQPLNIISVIPANTTIFGATDTIPVTIEVNTDNGFNNGEAVCSYLQGLNGEDEDYIEFLDTRANVHSQRQDLPTGEYNYKIRCTDAGGNTDRASILFDVEVDRVSPKVVRAYKEGSNLKLVTNEGAECSYSADSCNFEIDDGIPFSNINSLDFKIHTVLWDTSRTHFVRCKDQYDNQPSPNSCSIIVRPTTLRQKVEAIIL